MSVATLDAHPKATKRIKLLPHQYDAATCEQPYVAMVTGIGGGKTWFGSRWIISRAVEFPASIHLATINSYPQGRDVVIPALEDACSDMGLAYRWQSRNQLPTLFVDCGDGVEAVIRVRSTDPRNIDRVARGAEYGSWWGDEIRDADEYSVNLLLGRLRCRKVDQVRYLWTTTPNGYDHVWAAHVDSGNPLCALITAETSANIYLGKDYVPQMLSRFDSQMAQQELGGKFIAIGTGLAYYCFDRSIHAVETKYDAYLPLMLTCDYNVGMMGWVAVQKAGRNWYAIRCLGGHDIAEAAADFARHFRSHKGPIHLYGDPSGHAQNHAGETDFALTIQALRHHGLHAQLMAYKAHPRQRDRISNVNRLLKSASGETRLFVDRVDCARLMRDMEQVRWNDKGSEIVKVHGKDLTHVSDALGDLLFACDSPIMGTPEPGYQPARTS